MKWVAPMKRILAIDCAIGFALALNLSFANSADAESRLHKLCGWSVRSPQEAFDRVAKQQKVREIQRTSEYISFHDPVNNWVWTFTAAGHPAHPAVICRYETLDKGLVTLQMNVVCGGPKPVCDELVREFKEHNRSIIENATKPKQ
jgi:hypothetical protein